MRCPLPPTPSRTVAAATLALAHGHRRQPMVHLPGAKRWGLAARISAPIASLASALLPALLTALLTALVTALLAVSALHAAAAPRPQSLGTPDLGHLRDGRRLAASKRVRLRFPANAWGTDRLVALIDRCTQEVRDKHGRSHRLLVGDLSRSGGGHLRGHEGHQNGREADIALYMRSGKPLPALWRVGPSDIDTKRTLTFLTCWLDSGDILRVFLDRSLQEPLVREAKRRGWSAAKISSTFSYPRPGRERVGLVQHRRHHDSHMHVRLRCDDHEPNCIDKPYGAAKRRALAARSGSTTRKTVHIRAQPKRTKIRSRNPKHTKARHTKRAPKRRTQHSHAGRRHHGERAASRIPQRPSRH